MLTALNIEDHSKKGAAGLLNLFRRNRIRAEHLYCDSAAVKCLTYERYRGKIGRATIERFVQSERKRLLCPASLELPEESGFARYESDALSRRMCENAAIGLLRMLNRKDVRVALIDRTGDCAGLCDSLTDLADPVYVVTDAADIYIAQAEYLLCEKGAALRVSRSPGCLKYADLIISPARLESRLDCAADCLILSGGEPQTMQNSPVIYDYYFELPRKYSDIKPPFLEDMYFASALYELAGARELGAELFTRCGDGCVIHTRMSLAQRLSKRLEARETE